MAKEIWFTAAEFARKIGVDKKTVFAAIKSGRIKTVQGVGLQAKVIPDIALSEWRENYKPNRTTSDALRKALRLDEPLASPVDFPKEEITIGEAQRRLVALKAETAQVELDAKRGKLVDIAEVQKQLFELGSKARKALEVIPDRIVDQLVGRNLSRHETLQILQSEIKNALEELSSQNMNLK